MLTRIHALAKSNYASSSSRILPQCGATSHPSGVIVSSNRAVVSVVNISHPVSRYLATRSRPSGKSSSSRFSKDSPAKKWREAPKSAPKKSPTSKVSSTPNKPTSPSNVKKSPSKSSYASNSTKKKSIEKPRAPVEEKSAEMKRPHIVRDMERIEAARHQIRKVTGDVGSNEGGATQVSASGKTKFNPHFKKLRLMGPLLRALDDMGWSKPTPVQEQTIIQGIRGDNIVASAETGTGKTGAYALPMLQRIYVRKKYEEVRGIERIAAPLGIILCPTRELAEQVEDQLFELGKYIDGIRIVGISGALKQPELQVRELRNGVDILVATPGRLLRLLDETTDEEDEIEDLDVFPEMDESEALEDENGMAKYGDSKYAREHTVDDGFGVVEDGEEIDEIDVKDMDDDTAWNSLTNMAPKPIRKRKQKRDAIYAQWDKAWDELDKTAPNAMKMKGEPSNARFKERLPFIPKGGALKNSNIDLTHVRCLALDEVDRMLAMGLFPEVRHLFKAMPRPQGRKDPERMQVSMFTATLVPRVSELVKRFAPYHTRIDLNKTMNVAERVQQHFYYVGPRRKHALLTYLLRRRGSIKGMQTLVFCRTRQRVDRLAAQLVEEGFSAAGIHGDQSIAARQSAIDMFKNGETQILISTEIMARGMDIPQLPVVINYDLPHTPEEYIHRIGRTARAGNDGTAISFVSHEPTLIEVGKRLVELDETYYLDAISNLLQRPCRVTKVPGPWRDEAKVETLLKKSRAEDEAKVEQKSSNKPINHKKIDPKKASAAKNKARVKESSEAEPATPVLDVRSGDITGGSELAPKRKKEYYYLEDDAELRSAIPPERNVVKRAKEILTQLYDRKTRQVEHASKRKNISSVDDHRTALKTHVSLRDFKEGRYEDVMDEFDTKRARKLGVVVPKNLDKVIKKQRDAITKKFFAKKKERQERKKAML